MSFKELVTRFKQNIWMVEMSVFMFCYAIFVELNDTDDSFIYRDGSLDANFFIKNVGLWFFLTSVTTMIAACRYKTSLTMYMITLGFTTIAAFSRIGALSTGEITTDIWLISIVWIHIVIMQMVLLFRYPVRDNRQAIKEMINNEL